VRAPSRTTGGNQITATANELLGLAHDVQKKVIDALTENA
jgi:hypothetical protein